MSSNETPSDETRAQNDNAANRSEVSGPYLAPRDETEVSRFPPPDLPPGTIPPGAFVPGVVEVELRDDVRPHIAPAEDARPTIASRTPVDLSGLNEILQRYRLEAAEPSIQLPEQEAATAQSVARDRGIDVPNLGNFVTLRFPPDTDTRQVARELSQLPEVERAVPLPRAIPPQTPLNEPLVGASDQVVVNPATGLENQWYIFRCRANQAWSLASGDGVVIVDIDFGYRLTHQDLAPRLDLSRAFNAFDGGTNVSTGPSVFHGTGVLGIAGGADNNFGMAGFAFGASLWPVQADSGPGPELAGNSWARGIEYVRTADSNGRRKVIILEVQTFSYGNIEMVPSVNAAIRTAIAWDVVVCVAAGNGNRDAGTDDFGTPFPETGSILVGATEYHPTENRRAGFSNFGPRIVVSAPGDSFHDLTCSNAGDSAYRNDFGGTSGATPKVAGTAALMLHANPDLTHAEIRAILRSTGSAVVTTPDRPAGTFLNAEAAVRAAKSPLAGERADIAGFADTGVWVSRNIGNGAFQPAQKVIDGFGHDAGQWRVEKHPRFLADLTGDKRADVVGFDDDGVWIAINNGDGTFQAPAMVLAGFAYNAGTWRVERHPRFLADLTGDGCADIIGFGDTGVWISRNNGNGTFQPAQKVIDNFAYSAGTWRVEKHPRFVADLTGDGRADIVGFGDAGVWVALNNGNGTFQAPQRVIDNLAYIAGKWRVEKHPRFLADLTGDGRADIVGFGDAGVWTSFNNGDGTFQAPEFVLAGFGYIAGKWRVEKHPRFAVDLTGDRRADLVGFGDAGVWVSLNKGNGTFQAPQKVIDNFAYNAGTWRVEKHPRFVADLTGDKRADVIGFGDDGVWVALNNGNGTFQPSQFVLAEFGYDAGDWRVEKHPRLLAGLR